MFNLIKQFFNEHKGARRLLLLWAVCLITWVVVYLVTLVETITSADAKDIALAVIGLLGVVITFYQWSRNKDDD